MILNSTKAFAPANISLLFTIEDDPDPTKMGSRGIGFTVNEGITPTVSDAANNLAKLVRLNGKTIDFPTVETVIYLLLSSRAKSRDLSQQPLNIDLQSPLPLGCGFGLSGASALATAYAVNKLFNLNKANLELAKLAHKAEVINKTGLGDVTNQYFGGFCVKFETSANFKVQKLPFAGKKVYYRVFSTMHTKDVLSDQNIRETVNEHGNNVLKKLLALLKTNLLVLSDLLDLSYSFVVDTGLLQNSQVRSTIESIRKAGGHATMILLGNAVVADQPFEESRELTISNQPAHIF